MTTLSPPNSASTESSDLSQSVSCDHCGLPVARGLIESGAEQQFCCAGCRSVNAMIHRCGLDRYYALRDAVADDAGATPARSVGGRYDSFDDAAFLDAHVGVEDNGLGTIDFRLSNVHCAACVWLIERLPRALPGVIEARLSLQQGVARVTWDTRAVALSGVARALDALGYPPHPAGASDGRQLRLADERRMLIRVGVAGACAGNAMLLATALYFGLLDGMAVAHETFLRWVSLGVGLIALLGPAHLFFRGAWAGLRMRTATLDLPIALALAVGGIAGTINVVLGRGEVYFDSLSMLVFLLLVGRYLQMRQQRRATDAVCLMRSLTPLGCTAWRGNHWIDLPIEAIQIGDRVRIPSNERMPIDGVVVAGHSSVDTASLTGESRPAQVGVGDRVFAGSHNVGTTLEIEVHAVGSNTRLARLMEHAAASVADKPDIVRFADRIAGVFTLAVIGLAAAVFGGWWWAVGLEPAINHAVALLIVACPCALGLATPLTLAAGLGVAARRDVLVKDASVFEKLAAVNTITPGVLALDKTGTITEGQHQVAAWVGDEELQATVGLAERDARHPVGRALQNAYDPGNLVPFTHVVEDPRGGLIALTDRGTIHIGSDRFFDDHRILIPQVWIDQAQPYRDRGASLVWIAEEQRVAAFVALEDTLRRDSAAVIQKLAGDGWKPAILSGDLTPAVRRISEKLAIEQCDVHTQLTPEKKPRVIEDFRAGSSTVFMVGDGVNDAAALATADVGLAVHGGAAAAMEVADAYTARPGLSPIVELVELSRFTVRIVRQNLWVSLGYNATAVGLAAAGLLTPWIAAILMPVSSLTVLGLAVSRLGHWKGAASCP